MAKVSLEFDLSEEKIENYIRRFEEMLEKAEEVSTMVDDLESVIERLQKIVKEDEEAKRKARRTVTRKKKEA